MSLKSIYNTQNKLIQQLKNLSKKMFRGSVVKLSHTCGKKGCHCFTGEKHIDYYISVKFSGKPKMFYIPHNILSAARLWSKNYQRAKSIIDKITLTNIQILKQKEQKYGKTYHKLSKNT